MKLGASVTLTAASLLSLGTMAPAQEPPPLQDLLSPARRKWEVTLPLGPRAEYALLEDRVAVLQDGKVALHGFDNRPRGAVESKLPISTLTASPTGKRLLASSALHEDEHVASLRDPAGKELWSVKLRTTLRFSASGRFVHTRWSTLDASEPPTAFRTDDGKVAWRAADRPTYFDLATAENDVLAYYQRGLLQVFDLARGQELWRRPIPADPDHDLGKVRLSANGETIVVQSRVLQGAALQAVTQVYDREGTLLWEKRVPFLPGVSNGGIVTGISDDGALLAVDDINEFFIVRARDGSERARMAEKGMCCVASFTPERLVIERDDDTRVLFLDANGAVRGDRVVEARLSFSRRVEAAAGAKGLDRATLVRRVGDLVTLSEIDFDPAPRAVPDKVRQ